jgi:phosphoribosylanthranilate isomerase
VQRVGVFVDEAPERINAVADAAGLDVIQLHGDEPPSVAGQLRRRALKAFRVNAAFDLVQLDPWRALASGVVLDAAGAQGRPGGTGETFDWSRAVAARRHTPFLMVAGGLSPENVGAAIASARPDAVDVSSGVEASPGRKDHGRVEAFLEAVRHADARPGR